MRASERHASLPLGHGFLLAERCLRTKNYSVQILCTGESTNNFAAFEEHIKPSVTDVVIPFVTTIISNSQSRSRAASRT
ncbi:hypothetical protein EVAR_97331_1 [Eumeta japonica]|uniref:Uncharacterized protein n=1 Tax=Eumeta variegata TaxID=151549 RepID=A0A4C1X5D7_EUMVA|nr:hypothetical protein EVAR_97331_1 [Eumeta japonica]